MAQKEQTAFENPFFGYAETASNTFRELYGWQFKTTQNLFDQSLRAAQTYFDFAHTQAQEGARLSQEFMKMGMANTEEVKKSFNSFSEKFFYGPK